MARPKSIEDQLRLIVKAHGVRKIAEAVALDPSKVSRWISGERPIRANELEDMVKAVGCRLELVVPRDTDTGREGAR